METSNCKKVNGITSVMNKYSTFFFDMDGVIWCGEEPIPKAPQAIKVLQNNKKEVYFITNNSTRDRDTYVQRLKKFGIESDKDHVYSSGYLAALYAKKHLPQDKKVFIIGMQGLVQEFSDMKIPFIFAENVYKEGVSVTQTMFAEFIKQLDPTVGMVVVGLDQNFNYIKSCFASLYIQNGAEFVGTNNDEFLFVGGKRQPGNGTLVSFLEIASGKKALVLGKPNKVFLELIMNNHSMKISDSLLVGDNTFTDIQLGPNAGIDTFLVMTGNTDYPLLNKQIEEKKTVPNYYSDNL